jgi:hypothetical protein
MIPTVLVRAEKNPTYNTPTGNDTKDQVFLLSYSEVEKYFSDRDARKVTGTEYCSSKCTYIPDNGCLRWWLRTPGENYYRFCEVDSEGILGESGPTPIVTNSESVPRCGSVLGSERLVENAI